MPLNAKTWPQVVNEILDGFEVVVNATPDWLEVTGTGRRLVVDQLYPKIGMAVWFQRSLPCGGVQDESDGVRLHSLCQRAGFTLIVLDVNCPVNQQGLVEICAALDTSARLIARLRNAPTAQRVLLPQIAAARTTCQSMLVAMSSPPDEGTIYRKRMRRQRVRASLRQFRTSWRIFSENRLAVLGVLLLAVFSLMAVAHPILLKTVWPARIYSPDTGFDIDLLHPSAPSGKHLLGTDTVGRDVLSVLLASTAPTFVVGVTAAITAAAIGILVGALAAYFKGAVDAVFMQVADACLLLPPPLLMIILGARFHDMSPTTFGLIFGMGAGLGTAAIVIRSHALVIMNKPFIQAARVAGCGAVHVIIKHLIPHLLPLAAVLMMVTATGAVIADGFVSFLGITRTHHNWGNMIFWSFAYQATLNPTITWNVLIPPAVAFSLFAASFYFISGGLQRVADPKLRKFSVIGSATGPAVLAQFV